MRPPRAEIKGGLYLKKGALSMKLFLMFLAALPGIALAQDWSAEDVFGHPNQGAESIPLVPGVPPPPNYYGFANNSFKNGYTVIETETRKIDIFKAAAGLEDPHYTERKIQVVPNNSMGQPIVPFRLAP